MLPRIPAVFAYLMTVRRIVPMGAVCALMYAATATAQQPAAPSVPSRPPPPAPDIFLTTLTIARDVPTLGAPMNFTARPGYDNQPSFVGDESGVFFTSVRSDAQADIYRFDIATKRTTRVTTSARESEYSATSTDGGRAISVIRVERDSTQRLWRVPLNGGTPSVILERVRPVGYHAWADDTTLALFVLGSPNTLQLANTRTGRADTVATNIGRSLHRIPKTSRVSFVRRVSASEWWIESLDPRTRATERLMRLPEGVEDYAWLPNGSIVCGRGSTLLWWSGVRGTDWRPIGDLAPLVNGITRLAVSPSGKFIAIVGEGQR